MEIIKKEIFIGFLISFIVTFTGAVIYIYCFSDYGFKEILKISKEENLYGKIVALAAIPNLFVFFFFLKKKQDYRARGVLLATITIFFITVLLNFKIF